MQLDTYISDLLYRYDCVTIPNFGAFLTQRVSAKINAENHTFFPPKKIVSFNEQLQHNDGLLANYIADVEKIPFERAKRNIEKHVKSVKAYLIQGETVSYNNIGELILNSEGKTVFEPFYNVNYLTNSFGLSQFEKASVAREDYKVIAETVEEAIPITITHEKRKARPYLKYAAVGLIALTLGGLGFTSYYNSTIEVHNQIAQEDANDQLDAKVQEATFIIDNPLPAATFKVNKQSGNYHIVAGAFRIEANSNKKVNQLQELGYKARKIGANRYGLHQVVYASFETRLEAQQALRNIRRTHNSDAWLLVKNLNK
ncbi:SPOR domain-containing protein [Ichthyenterobacterium sp. W332]|uniref:SPOR domain-containing protein n=1 Tax=Microcosmobacter mediterraneus TaxID=3075607 RepID=A0ABU2YJW4_9FLAO|nr:SPOR domain-containing protein [Ichthyenterobacterium sp. W332]MDT0558105.1 SPOR domain-containing protein [Ichthyenterobacterium sp. W332]